MKFFTNTKMNVKDGPFDGIWGYDFHYVIPEGEALRAKELRELTVDFINKNRPEGLVFIDNHKQFDKPVGPWKTPMWQIQLSTIEPCTSPSDPIAISEVRRATIYKFMLVVADFLKKQYQYSKLSGTLLIHANVWPHNSNQVLEREMHFDCSWFVFGETVSLIDIWRGPNGLIAIEQFIKEQLEQKIAGPDIKQNCITHFQNATNKAEIERSVSIILDAQCHLKEAQDNMQEYQETKWDYVKN